MKMMIEREERIIANKNKMQTHAKRRIFTRTPPKNEQQNDKMVVNSKENNSNNGAGKKVLNYFTYAPHLDEEEVKCGLEKGFLVKGLLRVNQRSYEQCFIDNPDGEEHSDLLILGTRDRNRAFHGDLVAVRLKPKDAWFLHESFCKKYKLKRTSQQADFEADERKRDDFKLVNYHRVSELGDCTDVPEEYFKKTCEVVAILEKLASRRIVGHIKPMFNNMNFFLFSPTDPRIPRLLIPSKKAPTGFYERPQDFDNYIYLVQLSEWPEDSKMPKGQLLDNLGLAGDVEAEHKALLLVNAVDEREYESFPEVFKSLALPENPGEWTVDPKELTYRRDFRDEVVVTIDPLTARDLDDALHIKRVKNEEDGKECWEVGVHIADVAFFLDKGTELDEWACKRGTTTYLVHKVIPMLPRVLCEELCSLHPGVDRFTFSVVWQMDDQANIVRTWFGRSIIKSCAKMAYEHAQDIIENPTKQFAISEMPPIHCGKKIRDIKTTVKNLNFIATKLKAKRFKEGALKLDLPKLRFDLEKSSSGIWQPRGIRLDERKAANFLVEEFMLLANMEVAQRLHKFYNDRALLRRHPPPKQKELSKLVERCAKLGIHINSMTSKTLADSLKHCERDEASHYTTMPVLNQMLMKCMHLAQYFSTGTVEGPIEFRHYALSVNFYTHFTSPIRRYPDVIVHRLLAASLRYCPDPGYSIKELQKIAIRANQTKAIGKLCSEASGEIFFGALIRETGHFEAVGVVMAIFDECFEFLLLKYAIVKRVYLRKQKCVKRVYFGKLEPDGPVTLVLQLNGDDNATQQQQNGKAGGSKAKSEDGRQRGEEEEEGIDIEEEEDDEQDVEISEQQAPAWVRECRPEQRQTLNMLSVVRLRLMPLKNSVKYEANLVPTPDSNPLTWIDAKEHMEDLPPTLGSVSAEDCARK